jgi:hypothetical protein
MLLSSKKLSVVLEPHDRRGVQRNMLRSGILLIAGIAALVVPIYPCSCSPEASGPACSLIGSRDVIFTGRVAYSNDDGSGTFVQGTQIRFAVEEVFKGLPAGTAEVWIDPGSYTSCYAEYKVGGRYLMFASDPAKDNSVSLVAMLTGSAEGKRRKPVPPGFDIQHPPKIYVSAECHGSRLAEYADSDLQWLRAWQAGKTTTRIYGRVLEHYDMYFLPPRGEPALAGATVTAQGASGTYSATTTASGDYEIKGVPPGAYSLSASLERYHFQRDNIPIQLAAGACVYVNAGLFTTSSIAGTALGPDGKPLVGLKLDIARVLPDGKLRHEFGRRIATGSRGEFEINELSSGDFLLGVNLRYGPTLDVPYVGTYFPGTNNRASAQLLHLDPGEQKQGLTFHLPTPLQPRDVQVAVRWPNGSLATNVRVAAFLEIGGEGAGSVFPDHPAGFAVPCLKGLAYRIWARAFIDDNPRQRNRRITDGEVHLEAGDQPAMLTIVLDKPGVLP